MTLAEIIEEGRKALALFDKPLDVCPEATPVMLLPCPSVRLLLAVAEAAEPAKEVR